MKTCRICKCKFEPRMPMAVVCSFECAQALAVKTRQKAEKAKAQREKRETREKLDAMRTKPQLVRLAQTAFNAFIRARDAGKPCISCGKPLPSEAVGGAFDAGHYRSVGSAPHMRFVEDQVAGQCKHCNRYLAGNHVAYRAGLIERIGLARVEQIERDQTLRKYTRDGLIELARYYKEEAKKLKERA